MGEISFLFCGVGPSQKGFSWYFGAVRVSGGAALPHGAVLGPSQGSSGCDRPRYRLFSPLDLLAG